MRIHTLEVLGLGEKPRPTLTPVVHVGPRLVGSCDPCDHHIPKVLPPFRLIKVEGSRRVGARTQ